jgi:membrane fusion protein (multidrug efflux system)
MNTNQQASFARRIPPWLLAALMALIAVGLVAFGIARRAHNVADLRNVAAEESVPQVQIISPAPGPATRSITLPGTIKAWSYAPIYAQVSGYVVKWFKDYGAPVKAGEMLATVDAPAVDEQYESALADLEVAQTNYQLATVTAARWTALSGTQAVSQQEVDVKVADAAAQKAQMHAAEHKVARFKVLESFRNIIAPFDGVVTSRNTDVRPTSCLASRTFTRCVSSSRYPRIIQESLNRVSLPPSHYRNIPTASSRHRSTPRPIHSIRRHARW